MEIIGGPALRRTQTEAAYIWLALDTKPLNITVTVSTKVNLSSPLSISDITPSNIVKLGDKLFNCLIKVAPTSGSFPYNIKLYYDINIDDQKLGDFGLLTGDKSIVYTNEKLPSFVIPTKHTNILQGSCRKPHAANKSGHSQYDHMRTADTLLAKSINKLEQRPTMLCLTGDQIYADDVALPLLCALKEKAKHHLGWSEELPHSKDSRKIVSPDNLKLCARDKVLSKSIGFTSGEKENHLMSFGEYMMMYLAVWGGLSLILPPYASIAKDIAKITKKRHGKNTYKVVKLNQDDYEEQRAIVNTFLTNARKTRRVMANIASYMMFDDHEISDDWNLTEKNAKQFKSNPLSKRIQANGLAAYWACQGWGNDPAAFNSNYKSILSKFLTSESSKNGAQYDATLRLQRWNYTVEGYPVLVALDTRTKRSFKSGTFSQLMSKNEISMLSNEFLRINKVYKDDVDRQSLLLLSPAPFLGFTAMERVQLAADFLPNTVDGEPWIGSETAYKQMKKALSNLDFKQCCIISGDVHYAFSRCMQIPRKNKAELEVLQITSSALHNAPTGVMRILLDGLTLAEKSIFNRQQTPYLYPINESEFLNGHTNISHIQYKQAQPIKNTYTFFNPNTGKTYKWIYDFQDQYTVKFE